MRPRRKLWRTLAQGPPNRSLSGAGLSQWAKTLKGKSRTKEVMERGTAELIILGVLPWQPPESSNLQGWEDKLNRRSLRSFSTPLGLRNYRVALAPSPAWVSSAKNWRPGSRSLALSSQWPDPASPGMPCRRTPPSAFQLSPSPTLRTPRSPRPLPRTHFFGRTVWGLDSCKPRTLRRVF